MHAKTIIECVLHAAALNGARTSRTAYRWMQSTHAMDPPLRILESHPDACLTWDDRLRGLHPQPRPPVRRLGDERRRPPPSPRSSLPTVRAALTPTADPARDHRRVAPARPGTLYALATDRGAGASAGFVSALIEDIAYTARITAARSPGGRMDPPVLFLLDECANVAPIPSLPNLLADGRGQNLTVIPSSRPSPRSAPATATRTPPPCSPPARSSSSSAASDDADDCRDISGLIGERDDWYATTSQSTHALAIDTKATTSTSLRKVPILPPDAIRSIPFGSAVMLLSQADPFPLRMRPWTARPDADRIATQTQATSRTRSSRPAAPGSPRPWTPLP